MIEVLFWLAVISGAIASLVAWYYHEAAAGAKAWISIYAEEAATARAEADDLQVWCDAWEERALRAEADLLQLQGRHDDLQALYCDQVRAALAANSWIIFQSRRNAGIR